MPMGNGVRSAKQGALLGLAGLLLATTLGGCPSAQPGTGTDTPAVKKAPSFGFITPAANVTTYDSQIFTINWYVDDPGNTAKVEIYYDKDGLPASGDETLLTVLYQDTSTPSSSFKWNTNNIVPATYHLLAVVDDSVNPAFTVYAPGTVTVKSDVPTVAFTQPSGAQSHKAGDTLLLQWNYDTPLKDATVSLFYDTDKNPANGTTGQIAVIPAPKGNAYKTFTWTMPKLPAGQYYLGATLNDGTHTPATSYAPASIAIDQPAVYIDSPASDVTLHCAGSVAVKWHEANRITDAAVRIFYDKDGLPGTGDEVTLLTLNEPVGQVANTQLVTIPAVTPDTYYLGIELVDGLNKPIIVYAPGAIELTGPQLTFTIPAAAVTTPYGVSTSVRWLAETGGLPAKVTLFYDTDRVYGNGVAGQLPAWTGTPDPLGNSTAWTIPTLAAGTYYFGGVLDDGVNPPVVAYAPGQFNVTAPTLTVAQPAATVNVRGGDVLPISWQARAANANATVTVFYDSDRNFANGTLGQIDVHTGKQDPAGDSTNWTIPALAIDTYYVGVKLDDGSNPPVIVYAPGQVVVGAPSLTMTAPTKNTSVKPGATVPVSWKAQAGGSDVTVSLFYDDDTTPDNALPRQFAQVTTPPSPTGDSANWVIPADLAAGTYYVYAVLSDDVNPPVTVYASAQITVSTSTLNFTNPAAKVNASRGATVTPTWVADTTGRSATVTLFYDDDQVFANGTLGQIGLPITKVPSPTGDSISWTIPNTLKAGKYYIVAQLDDGVNPVLPIYSSGYFNIPLPTITLNAPAASIPGNVGGPVNISWVANTSGESATVALFYDSDSNVANGTLGPINAPIVKVPAPAGDSAVWTVPSLAAGSYYIGATLTNGVGDIVTTYAVGTVDVAGPTASISQPSTVQQLLEGAVVPITYTYQTQAAAVKIDLFYNTSKTPAGSTAITTINPASGSNTNVTYNWTLLPSVTGGPFYIGMTVTDGLNAPITVYAPATFTVANQASLVRPLEQVESQRLGRTFRGLAPNGNLGGVIGHVPWTRLKPDPKSGGKTTMHEPGISTNNLPGTTFDVAAAGKTPAKTYDDFVLVAPHATPYYLTRPGAGEAYLILSDPNILFAVPAVGTFSPIYVTATGTSLLPGAIFAGPSATPAGTNNGIGDVAISRPAKSDTAPDILFGIPLVQKIVQEEQDYDPWDYWIYDYQLSLGFPSSAVSNFTVSYGDKYRPPTSTTGPTKVSVDGTEAARNGAWNSITAGMVIAVSSTTVNANNPNPITTATGTAPGQQILFPLDNVGQASSEPHPRVVSNSYSPYSPSAQAPGGGTAVLGSNLLGPKGLRYYAPWWLSSMYGTPQYHQYQKLQTTNPALAATTSSNDNSQFGTGLIEADLDGDGKPEWLTLQPFDPETGTVTTGLIHIQWTDKSQLWDTNLDALILQGGGQVTFTPVTRTITINITDTGTTTVQSPDQRGGSVTVTAPIAPSSTFCQRVYSWPYAVSASPVSADFVTTTTTTTTTLTGPPAVNTTSTAVAYGYEGPPSTTHDRNYCWPMISDTLKGEAGALLTGLANAGDFNGDHHEDFTIGSPGLNSNAGASYLVFGQAQYGDLSLGNIGATAPILPGLKIVGTANSKCGTSQAAAGDVNGDAVGDWIIGAPGYSGGQGAVGVIFGNQYIQGVYNFSDIGTTKLPGLIFTGETAGDNAGMYVAGVGDADGDGYDDIVVVAPFATKTVNGTPRTGVAYLIYGSPTLYNAQDPTKNIISLSKVGTATLPGKMYYGSQMQAAGTMGLGPVAPAGDVDDDGFADFLIGNPNYNVIDPTGATIVAKPGEIYLIRGSSRWAP